METNPYQQEATYANAEYLREIVGEYNRLNERRMYLVSLIREAAKQPGADPAEIPEDLQLTLDKEAFMDQSDEL